MRKPALHLSGRAGEGILFVQLPRGEIQHSLLLCSQGMRSKASIGERESGQLSLSPFFFYLPVSFSQSLFLF